MKRTKQRCALINMSVQVIRQAERRHKISFADTFMNLFELSPFEDSVINGWSQHAINLYRLLSPHMQSLKYNNTKSQQRAEKTEDENHTIPFFVLRCFMGASY